MGHETVFRSAAVNMLIGNPEGLYVDTTYGRGGHAEEILGRLEAGGKLMAIDKDLQAVADAQSKYKHDPRIEIVHGSFGDLESHLENRHWSSVDGILMDLGVSSPQLDEADRGFSFLRDGPLDMRMDRTKGITASDWLNHAKEQEIRQVIKEYGEERFARRIASAIVSKREEIAFSTTRQLAEVIEIAIPFREKHKHPATRSFQAIRIFINEELEELKNCLNAAVIALKPQGKLVVISFHSLEDRIVKRFMRDMARGDNYPRKFPVKNELLNKKLRLIAGKIRPSEDEVKNNIRARSAIMRVAERLAG